MSKDKQLILRYTIAGNTRIEALGWLSEGYTAQDAQNKIKSFRKNKKLGEGPTSLAEEKKILQTEIEQKRTDLEQETIEEVVNILKAEFE